ncbi:sulfatase [Thermostilla marina]
MLRRRIVICGILAGIAGLMGLATARPALAAERPNVVFIFVDDQRFDALGCVNPAAYTPNMDRIAAAGVRFENAFVTLSICSPSRAAVLTGHYGSRNGVTTLGKPLAEGEITFAQLCRRAGYATALIGKWHLATSPQACGFDRCVWFRSNGPHYDRTVHNGDRVETAEGFIEEYNVRRSLEFIDAACEAGKPFVLHWCTQVPHMTGKFTWEPSERARRLLADRPMPLPASWRDDLAGKPPYLKGARSRVKAQTEYGYTDPERIRAHFRDYLAEIADLDRAIGVLLDGLAARGLDDRTYIILMGDNGWMMGDHGLTSKVLAYEPSIRVPLLIAGPGIRPGVCAAPALNIDVMPTILEMTGVPAPDDLHGRSLMPLCRGESIAWRDGFFYEAPTSALEVKPHFAWREAGWKYIRTFAAEGSSQVIFEELYDLRSDPDEMDNLADDPQYRDVLARLRARLEAEREKIQGPTE